MKLLFAEAPAPKLNLSKKLLLLNWPFIMLITAIALDPSRSSKPYSVETTAAT